MSASVIGNPSVTVENGQIVEKSQEKKVSAAKAPAKAAAPKKAAAKSTAGTAKPRKPAPAKPEAKKPETVSSGQPAKTPAPSVQPPKADIPRYMGDELPYWLL